jgi:hypothetical protein
MKINVDLYGGKGLFGGKETPLEADEIYCDMFEQCTFYKENKCLRCRSFLAPTCKFGRNNVIKGYTSRARKYYDFKNKYQTDEVYSKLKYPTKLVAIIGDNLYMNLKFTLVRKKKEEKTFSRYYRCINDYEISEVGFCTGDCLIPLTDITNDLLYGIFSYNPQAMMGGVIERYQKEVVPEVLLELKKLLPNIYNNFVSEYPRYDITPNYVGKKAYINSLKPGTKFMYKGYMWLYDGEYVSTENYDIGLNSPWFSEKAKYSDVKIKVNDKMLFEISDNSIVDEDTKFE